MIKVFLRDIPDTGLRLHKSVEPQEIELADDGFRCLTPLRIDLRLDRADDAVTAEGHVQAKYQLTCARCLESIEQERDDRIDLSFELEPDTEFINVGEDIRQELILALTGIIRCREDCRGICAGCGVNLNNEKCKCEGVL